MAQQSDRQSISVSSVAVHEFTGYTARWWAVAPHQVILLLTGSIVWVLAQLHIHASPTAWTLQKCPLSRAEFVRVQFINGHQELARVHRRSLSRSHQSGWYSLQDGGVEPDAPTLRFVTVLLVTYVYDAAHDTFGQLPGMPANLPLQLHNAKTSLKLIEEGSDWSILNPPDTWPRQEVQMIYGKNDMSAGQPIFVAVASAVLVHPMFVIQYCELVFLFYSRYHLSSFLLWVTLSSAFLSTYQLFKRRQALFQSVDKQRLIPLVQNGRVSAVSSRRLVPGDVLVVLPGKACCDMVLLQGNCLVEESNLSGEAAQVRKSSFVSHANDSKDGHAYHPETHQSCTVHAGTVVQQVWADGTSDDEVLAMVVRTGYRSTMGNMLRQVVAPLQDTGQVQDSFMQDLRRSFGFSLCLHCCIFIIVTAPYLQTYGAVQTSSITSKVLSTIVTAVPVAAPTVIIWVNAICSNRLKAAGISVLSMPKLRAAANVNVVCFDKTGTLTGSVPQLHGMLPVERGRFTGLQQSAVHWPDALRQAAAVCKSLILITKNHVVGTLADKQAFKAVEAHFLVLVEYAGQSFRLMAVAAGRLHGVTPAELAGMDLQQAEARCSPMDCWAC